MPTRRPEEAAQSQVAPETPSLEQPEQQAAQVGEQPWLLFDPEVSQVMHAATTQGWQPDQLRTALQGSKAFSEIQERRQALQDPERGQQARQELAQEVAYMTGRPATDPLVLDMAGRLESGQATMAALKGLVDPMQQGTPQSRVLELAKAHGIPMSQQAAGQWARMPEAEIDGQLAQMSQSLYPWKPSNLPYQQVAQVFADVKSRELGRRVDWDDPRLDDLMAQSQGQLSGFRQTVRELPEWAETDQAKELIQQRQDQVMHALLNGDATEDSLAANQQLIAGMTPVGQPQEQPAMPSQAAGGGPALAAPLIGPGREGREVTFGQGDGRNAGVTLAAIDYVKSAYGLGTVGGWRAQGSVPGSDHPKGLAIDAMIGGDMAKGDAIAADFQQNAGQWGVKYIIWNRRIWSPDRAEEGWRSYRGPSPHTDHPHISFTGQGGGGQVSGLGQVAGAASAPAPQPSPFGNYGLRDNPDMGLQDLYSAAQGQQPQAQAQSFGGPMVGGPSSSGDWRSSLSPAERWIIQRESSFRPEADNPTSTAFGLGQLLLANRIKYLGDQYNTTDPGLQLQAFRAYVRDRYGSAERAKSFWQAKGWY